MNSEQAIRNGQQPAFLTVKNEMLLQEIKELGARADSNATDALISMYHKGVSHGRHEEVQNIRKWLEEYKADSVVAKLLLQIMDREADIEAMS